MNVDIARKWLGTPFKHQGRSRGIGVDCAGLAIGIARDHGIEVHDVTGYTRLPRDDAMRQLIEQQCIRIDAIEIGAILYMPHAGTLHLAIVTRLDPTYIIHAYQPVGRVIEHRLDGAWLRRVQRIYRYELWRN